MTDDVPVASWLAKPYWPWPLALAYSQSPAHRAAAIFVAVEVLEAYPRLGSMAEYTGLGAIGRVYEIVTKEQDPSYLDEGVLRGLEAPLVAAIEAGQVFAQGRREPTSRFEEIRVADWIGGEIDGEGTCDLVKAGWREKHRDLDAMLERHERVVWFYDVHLPRSDMLAAFGEMTGDVQPPIVPPQPWTEARMKSEIAACAIADRDRAWREVFKPIRDQHRWDVTAFRGVWSEGRGTKGMSGRPAKPA